MSFKNEKGSTSLSEYYLPKVEIKNFNVKINSNEFFDQPINSDIKTCENIRKTATGEGDDYTSGCLLD